MGDCCANSCWVFCTSKVNSSTVPSENNSPVLISFSHSSALEISRVPECYKNPAFVLLYFLLSVPCSQVHKFMSHSLEPSVTPLIYFGLSHYSAPAWQLTLDVFAHASRRHVLFCRTASVKSHLRLLSLSKVFLSTPRFSYYRIGCTRARFNTTLHLLMGNEGETPEGRSGAGGGYLITWRS